MAEITDTETLNELIKNSGLKKQYIADQLGITQVTLCNKLNNKTKFTNSEIIALQRILHLSDEQTEKKPLSITEIINNMLFEGLNKEQKEQLDFLLSKEASEIASAIVNNDEKTLVTLRGEPNDKKDKILSFETACKTIMETAKQYYVDFDAMIEYQRKHKKSKRKAWANPTKESIKDIENLTELDKEVATAICALYDMGNIYITSDMICLVIGVDPCKEGTQELIDQECGRIDRISISEPRDEECYLNGEKHKITMTKGHCIECETYTIEYCPDEEKTVLKLYCTPILSHWLNKR